MKLKRTTCSQCIYHRPNQCWNAGKMPVDRQGNAIACIKFLGFEAVIRKLKEEESEGLSPKQTSTEIIS